MPALLVKKLKILGLNLVGRKIKKIKRGFLGLKKKNFSNGLGKFQTKRNFYNKGTLALFG